MNNIILNYLLKNFLKTIFVTVLVFYCFGLILSLFEEIEFFKNINNSLLTPLILTSLQVPSIIVEILPFIIFISSMWFMARIRNNKDLLTLKVFGFSNLKIFFILAIISFILGWLILFIVNPVTSSLSVYYEKTKFKFNKLDINKYLYITKNEIDVFEIMKLMENDVKLITFKGKGTNRYILSTIKNIFRIKFK